MEVITGASEGYNYFKLFLDFLTKASLDCDKMLLKMSLTEAIVR